MRFFVAIALAVLAGAAGAAVVLSKPGLPPAGLLQDIDRINKQVAEAQLAASGADGLIGAEARLRLATLETTSAMLEQRRLAWLRGINITFKNAHPGVLLSQEELKRIKSDMQHSVSDAANAEVDAAQYTGGLIQLMDKVRVATSLAAVTKFQQELAFARYGEPVASADAKLIAPSSTSRNVTSDKGAL